MRRRERGLTVFFSGGGRRANGGDLTDFFLAGGEGPTEGVLFFLAEGEGVSPGLHDIVE